VQDPRITRIGPGCGARGMDELPQFIDVLLGHMSLVGPRPEVPRYVAHYPPALRDQALAVRPGITDPPSLAYIDEASLLARAPTPSASTSTRSCRTSWPAADYAERATCGPTWRVLLRARCGCCWQSHAWGRNHEITIWHRLDRCWRGCGRTASRCRC
jgi:hypothetical protein